MRGVTPGAEPDAGSDDNAESPSPDLDQAATSAAGPADAGAQRQAGPAGSAASPDDAKGPAAGEAPAGSGTAGRKPVVRRSRGARFLRELVILVVIALVIAVVIKTYAIQAFFIPSGSMENTLEINDRVLVNKIVYDTRSIHRGDIVVFNGDGSWDPAEPLPANSNFAEKFVSGFASMFGFGHPGDILIKRVIGLPGDTVACCDAEGRVTVNGVPLNEQSYLYPGAAPSQDRFNIIVPQGRLWVMGDNRSISDDSRDHEGDPGGGTVPENSVIGRAFVIIWPPGRWRILPIPATFEQPKLNSSSSTAAAGTTPAGPSAAAVLSARLEPSSPALPLSLGFAAAIPVSWLQRKVRRRAARRRAARRVGGGGGRPALAASRRELT
jgi:signal peptidase I